MHPFDEIEASVPGLGVIYVAGHREVPALGIVGPRRAQLAPCEQPRFHASEGEALRRAKLVGEAGAGMLTARRGETIAFIVRLHLN